ncbi:MAG: glycoside hydrolase family 5 protein [Treponema sp.]|jgi:hypothetical protein|nr:glycoside hydrolase family 5 protein [Treponema sp.]
MTNTGYGRDKVSIRQAKQIKKRVSAVLLGAAVFILAQCAGQPSQKIYINRGEVLSRPLHVEGNKIYNDLGEEVRLTGVNICSLEWSAAGDNVPASAYEVFTNWNCNIVRVPLSQDRWLGKLANQNDSGAAYRQIVDEVVALAASFGKYVELDLHWSNAGEWRYYIGQHYMPDENSLEFWLDMAKTYANHPAVVFNIYNEPHSISWEIWRNGGTITETVNAGKPNQKTVTYDTPGHQKFVEEIRKTGANNMITVGGLGYAFDLKGIAKDYSPQSYALVDTPEGNGIVYETHIYPDKLDYIRSVACIFDEYPVLVGEIGIDTEGAYGSEKRPTWLAGMLNWIDENNLPWIAWSFHTGAKPCLITDWTYRPTQHFGVIVKEKLLSYPDTNAHLRKPR